MIKLQTLCADFNSSQVIANTEESFVLKYFIYIFHFYVTSLTWLVFPNRINVQKPFALMSYCITICHRCKFSLAFMGNCSCDIGMVFDENKRLQYAQLDESKLVWLKEYARSQHCSFLFKRYLNCSIAITAITY